MEENKFNQIIKSEQFNLVSDLAEISLDSFTNNDYLKDFPMIGSIVKVFNIGNTMDDRFFIEKLLHFLKELNDLDQEFILKEIRYIDDSEKYNRRVGEKILEIINRIDSEGKPKIIGRLFRNFIDKKISYLDFLKLADIVEKSFYYDLLLLKECKNGKFYIDLDKELYNLDLVTGQGIGSFDATEEERAEFNRTTFLITAKGTMLLDFGLK